MSQEEMLLTPFTESDTGKVMVSLVQENCAACRADAPRVTEEETAELLPQLPHWQVVDREGIPQLERTFPFKNFASALDFALRVGRVAEAEGHHPLLMVEDSGPPPQRLHYGGQDRPALLRGGSQAARGISWGMNDAHIRP